MKKVPEWFEKVVVFFTEHDEKMKEKVQKFYVDWVNSLMDFPFLSEFIILTVILICFKLFY